MSTSSNTVSTDNQRYQNYDTSFIFLRDNKYITGEITSTSAVDYAAGTLMGRVSATGKLVPLDSTLTNGGEIPIGILAHNISLGAAETKDITICIAGEVAAEKVVFQSTDTLATVVDGRRYEDRIQADNLGILLINSTELTAYDNS